MSDVTRLLSAIDRGEPQAAEELLPLVYAELRRLAAAKMAQEKPGHTLQATALVHEAYLRLVGSNKAATSGRGSEIRDQRSDENNLSSDLQPQTCGHWHSRGHFFAAAAEAMRRILVESARRKSRLKRGGDLEREPIDDAAIAAPEIDLDLIALDAALDKLAAQDPRKAELVKLRYFAGLTQQQAADALGIGISTADRDWAYARAWLYREISP
jgi:RNA polymerase sigma factor (sigma-70 family)